MKTKIFLIIILIFTFIFSTCRSNPVSSGNGVIITDDTPPPDEIPVGGDGDGDITDPENDIVKVVLFTNSALKFYDENIIWTWKSTYSARAESGVYSSENVLYYLNEYGQTIDADNLVVEPDFIRIIDGDIYIIENIPPEDAFAQGALYKNYTKIYLNNVEYGNWLTRDYKIIKTVVSNDELYGQIETGAWYHLNGLLTDINIAQEDLAIYDYDTDTKTAKINNIPVSWITNFMNSAKYWLKSDEIWYSQNGYTFDGATLTEDGSILTDWRIAPFLTGYTDAPWMISAGRRWENGEYVLYWIECNSGWVIRFVPSSNQQTLFIRIYTGDGERTTGVYYKDLLKPIIIENHLYFIYDAQTYRYNFTTGLTGHFASGVSEVWEF